MSDVGWDVLVRQTTILEGPVRPYSSADCDAAARRLGLPGLPPSYCEYVTRFGFGEWKDDLSICVPCDPKLVGSLDDMVRGDEDLFDYWLSEAKDMIAQGADRFPHLLSFADTTMGFSFSWDSSTRKAS